MGNFEKLVVLTVLFVAAIVLAVALNRGKGEVEAGSPLTAAEQRLVAEGLAPIPEEERAPVSRQQPSLVLSAGESGAPGTRGTGEADAQQVLPSRPTAEPEAPAGTLLAEEPASDPTAPILVEVAGLRPSFLDDYRVYTVAEGDTWSGLAQRFYRDGRFTRNLHLANEGLEDLRPGTDILVPVYDFLQESGLRPALGTAAAPEKPTADTIEAGAGSEPAAPRPGGLHSTAPAGLYVVQSGDTLSDISLAAFGTATRWQEILDANRDQLAKPESLQVGMKLKIPAGGKVPVTPEKKAVDGKGESAPKTAQSGKGSKPKKKVL
jgi:nucleoid-associated protein YgaU